MVVFGNLKKVIKKHSASISDGPTATEQHNIKLVLVPTTDADVSSNDLEEGTDTSSFGEVNTNKLYKIEEILGTMMEKLDDISQRMGNAEKKQNKSDALISKLNQRLERYSRRMDNVDNSLYKK